jgi:polysaccharide pyruvyl transferase WcaK-like protein
VLERQYLDSHRQLIERFDTSPSLALFFDPAGESDDGLLPVAAPAELAFAATYLYGGGYLNQDWGARKLTMLGAAEALLLAGGTEPSCHLASGLQVDPAWVAGLEQTDASALRCFDFLGARDGGSQRSLAALGPEAVVADTGDDAIGLLQRLPTLDSKARDGAQLLVNVHFAEHGWVSARPDALIDLYPRLLKELGRLAGLPIVARPVIAYQDGRVDERAAAERLRIACVAHGIEVTEPQLLRPASLVETAPLLGEASLTVSCSYHVALTSLVLEVPTVLVADNPYYEQKAAGLAAAFGLPPTFTTVATTVPEAKAAELAAVLFDADRSGALRSGLAAGGSELRRRRAATETELLARLAAAAAAALGGRVEELAERLRQRSAEPAELQAQLAERQTELEALRGLDGGAPLEAELRAQEAEAEANEAAEALATVLGSRSWRLMAPLRRLGALLGRR